MVISISSLNTVFWLSSVQVICAFVRMCCKWSAGLSFQSMLNCFKPLTRLILFCIIVVLLRFFSQLTNRCRAGLHSSESSKGQIIKVICRGPQKSISFRCGRFRCSMEKILERQLLIRGRAFATFSTIAKALAGRKKSFRGPHAARGPYVLQACYSKIKTEDNTLAYATQANLILRVFVQGS